MTSSGGSVVRKINKSNVDDIISNIQLEVPSNLEKYNKPLYKETEVAAIARIQANRKYLQSINKWNTLLLTLPDIFINRFQCERFKFNTNGGFIQMICREKYLDLLYKKIEENKSA